MEVLVKPTLIAAVVAAVLASGMAIPIQAQQGSVPTIPFESVAEPLKMPPDINFGEIAGVAVNSKGHVFVFSRGNSSGPSYMATAAQLLEFDQTGKFIREIGKNMYAWSYAHAVKIDKQDNIWVVDKGSDTILKMNPEGRVQYVFGRKGEASHYQAPPDTAQSLGNILKRAGLPTTPANPRNPPPVHQDGYFNQPTDIAWDADGNAYFSDGYVNSRVAKVSAKGEWLASWGSFGKGPGQFDTPHGVAIAPNGEVYVADRGNRRIQVFDQQGTYKREFTVDVPVPPGIKAAIGATPKPEEMMGMGSMAPGAPDALCMTPGPNPVIFTVDLYPGRIYKVSLDGKVLGVYGKSGKNLGEFGWGHAIACPSENEIWVGELLNWRVQKLVVKTGAGQRPVR